MTDLKLTYTDKPDQPHTYTLNGVRAKSVTAVAKMVQDSYAIDQYNKRMVGIGVTLDSNIRENIAVDIENKDAVNKLCEEAIRAAKGHLKADRGTQKHRVLELVLLDQEEKLITDQQRADAVVLKRTMDRYKLTPCDGLVEQFVAWPEYTVTGRFDAVLERPDGELAYYDLKSGENAVLYPQSTAAQFALYTRAPHISDGYHGRGDRCTVTQWRTIPDKLDKNIGYVLLVQEDDTVGTRYEIDMEHGWKAAEHALALVNWRKTLNRGKDIAHKDNSDDSWGVLQPVTVTELISRAQEAATLDQLRELWNTARDNKLLTPIFRVTAEKRSKKLTA